MLCKFCNKEFKSVWKHEDFCKLNPNKKKCLVGFKEGNQLWKKAPEPWNKGKKVGPHPMWRETYPNEKIFVENSTYARHSLKDRIFADNLLENKCAICDIPPIWMDKPMPLILDHINGINNDNRLENLRLICSNCDSQLKTYKARNKKKIN